MQAIILILAVYSVGVSGLLVWLVRRTGRLLNLAHEEGRLAERREAHTVATGTLILQEHAQRVARGF